MRPPTLAHCRLFSTERLIKKASNEQRHPTYYGDLCMLFTLVNWL